MANRLADETSPYLLQHKDNPVDWYPWGPEALARAKREGKPMLVSIGYSACHWCHVMEHESFEDERTAALMNDRFVCIKVDREERPDLDSIYMTAVQAMTGHGGWPLNVFVTPDGVPFYGGTYWPPQERMGMPSFTMVLTSVSDAYRERREAVEENAARLGEYLRQATGATPKPDELTPDLVATAFEGLRRTFDAEHGGFGGAPKFPQPMNLDFLLRYAWRTGDKQATAMVELTLDKMAAGGIYDQIGGGFARYTVDAVWLVPHFEKMLYDNAQLARMYLDGYRALGHERYRRVAEETLDYVVREMTSPEGGFYSAQDADSEGEEGKFYVWTREEIEAVLGQGDTTIVNAYYGVTAGGNFEGRNILHVPRPAIEVASELGVTGDDLQRVVAAARPKLYAAREERVRPGRDDKVLTSWNGLMLRAFAEASRVLGSEKYRQVAERNAAFVLTQLRHEGRLLRTYKDGQAKLNGYLEDYAYYIDGLIALYEATFDPRWLDEALALTGTMIDEFANPDGPGFFDTGESHETLVARPRDLQDGATPAGNSVAAGVLLKLGTMTGREELQNRAVDILRMMGRPMSEQPVGFGRYLATAETYLAAPREIALVGSRGDPGIDTFAAEVYQRYEPHAVIGLSDPVDPATVARLPFLAERPQRAGQATAYLCERFTCLPPVTEPADLGRQLEEGVGTAWREF